MKAQKVIAILVICILCFGCSNSEKSISKLAPEDFYGTYKCVSELKQVIFIKSNGVIDKNDPDESWLIPEGGTGIELTITNEDDKNRHPFVYGIQYRGAGTSSDGNNNLYQINRDKDGNYFFAVSLPATSQGTYRESGKVTVKGTLLPNKDIQVSITGEYGNNKTKIDRQLLFKRL